MTLAAPAVFSLDEAGAVSLAFDPRLFPWDIGTEFENTWTAEKTRQAAMTWSSPPAASRLARRHPPDDRWDGDALSAADASYRLKPNPQTLPYCRFVIEHAGNAWDPG